MELNADAARGGGAARFVRGRGRRRRLHAEGFVPRPATESLYEAVAVVPDDHPLCGRAARDAIAGASAELLSEPLLGAPT